MLPTKINKNAVRSCNTGRMNLSYPIGCIEILLYRIQNRPFLSIVCPSTKYMSSQMRALPLRISTERLLNKRYSDCIELMPAT